MNVDRSILLLLQEHYVIQYYYDNTNVTSITFFNTNIMAKTFRNANADQQGKIPNSEKDILDFLNEEPRPINRSITEVTPTATEAKIEKKVSTITPSDDIRQTFVIGQNYLEKLKDFVYTKRKSGDFEYTQKNAIHDALDLLFKGNDLLQRPESIKQKEAIRSRKIKNGIYKGG